MEYILCAAMHFPNEETPAHNPKNIDMGVVLCGRRHHNIIGQFNALTGKRIPEVEYTDGFITSLDRYVDRKEAMKIAINAKQVSGALISDLYSEDLY